MVKSFEGLYWYPLYRFALRYVGLEIKSLEAIRWGIIDQDVCLYCVAKNVRIGLFQKPTT